jgi:fluoroquinolone transport system permease protein
MKRLAQTFLSDVQYQWRYGFYLIYIFLIVCFFITFRIMPEDWRPMALTIILLSDPALIGFLYIGGILQLERSEGLLDALFATPLRPWEYIMSKALSLGLLATAAACAIALGSGVPHIRYAWLVPAVLLSSMCFTLIGLSVAVNLKSMNAYLGISGLWEAVLLSPPLLLLAFDIRPLEVLPGSLALSFIQASVDAPIGIWPIAGLIVWTAAMFWLAHARLKSALCRLEGGAA